jgi:multidrug resistance efflux pump
MGQLEDATRAYRAAETALQRAEEAAKARISAAREARAEARRALAQAVVKAAKNGVRQVDIIRITGYSRERVRTILREGGVEPD